MRVGCCFWESPLVNSNYQLPGPVGQPPESKSPSEWLLLLFWRQRWILVVTMILALAGAFAYLKVATPLYTSTAKLLVQPATPIALSSNSSAQFSNSPQTFTNAQMELMKSDTVLAIAGSLLESSPNTRGRVPSRPQALRDVVNTELDRTTDIISVTAKDPNNENARQIATQVVQAFIKFTMQPKQYSSTPEMLQQYENEKKKYEEELSKRQEAQRAMEAEHGSVVRQGEKTSLEETRLDALRKDLSILENDLIAAEENAAAARKRRERLGGAQPTTGQAADDLANEVDIGIGTPQEQQALRLEIMQVETQLRDLEHKYLKEHPAVVSLRGRLDRLNRLYLLSIEQREVTLRRQVDRMRAEVDTAQQALARLDVFAAQYKEIKADIERLRGFRDQFDSKIRQIKLERDTGGVKIDTIEAPKAEEKPSLPDKGKVIVIAAALGMVLGMVLAALREWLDDRMRSAGEIKSSLGMPLLAVIPQSATKRSFSVSGQRVLLDPASDAAEAYRSLRSAIQFASPEGLKTLLISSPGSGDGKTTLTTNLGIALAQAGKRVCIVDADLRKPTIHEIFSLKTNVGLSTLLAGRSSLDNAVQHTSVGGLDVLPCGPVPANPAEVLNSQEFGSTLELLADRYDLVLLDSPPVMSADDARVIAASCDATLIVLTAQTAHRRMTENTRDALQSVGARIIGLVVNDVPRKGNPGYGPPNAMRQLVPGLTTPEYDVLQTRSSR